MDLLTELRAVASYLKIRFPGCTTTLTHPSRPVGCLWVIRPQTVKSEQISAGIVETTRELQVVIYHESEETALSMMDALRRDVIEKLPICGPCWDAVVWLEYLAHSAPVKLDGGLFALIGVLKTRTRAPTKAAHDFGREPLIAKVHALFLERLD